MGHRMLPIAFPPLTNTRCHGNEIWDKIGYNLVTVVIGLATVKQKSEAQYLCNWSPVGKQYFSNKTANIIVQNISLYTC